MNLLSLASRAGKLGCGGGWMTESPPDSKVAACCSVGRTHDSRKNQACCSACFDFRLTTTLETVFGFPFPFPLAFAALIDLTPATAV